MEVHLCSKVCNFSLGRQCMQHLNYFWVTHELTRLGEVEVGKGGKKKKKKSNLLNKPLILWEVPMAKKMLAASEFSPLESEMKVVYPQVASSGARRDLLDSCLQ